MSPTPSSSVLPRAFFPATYSLLLLLSASYLPKLVFTNLWTGVFGLLMLLTYNMLYLLPALLLSTISTQLFSGQKPFHTWINRIVAVVGTAATLTLLFVDRTLFHLFNFHLNGFVWNLITTPGGIESMGGSASSTVSYGAMIVAIIVEQTLLLALLLYFARSKQPKPCPAPRLRYGLIALFVILASAQALMYGVSSFRGNLPIINIATALPLYQPLTLKGLAKKLGFSPVTTAQIKLKPGEGTLRYPLETLAITPPDHPLNIVWLVAESWRADMLNPETMPNMNRFAKQSINFKEHYSGGNGTRMGMFSQFYGLYGAYWFQFLAEQRSPVVMDVLQQQDYQLSLYTSALFTYPEFDKTLFANVPKQNMHDRAEGAGWQRDEQHVSEMLEFMTKRDTARPFMTFMFFESPHARYYFPPEDAIRTPYLEDFNYATMSLKRDMGLIRNRYINANHHLDRQLARVIDYLKTEDLLKDTMVIITGDHGEEFMENGNWGHNSEFTEQQIRVPLILWIPGIIPQEINQMTSHLDIPATLLPRLGVSNNASTYSLGTDLLGPEQRHKTLISDWARIAYVDRDIKAIFPISNKSINRRYFTTKQDRPLKKGGRLWSDKQGAMVEILHNLRAFLKMEGTT